MYLQLAGTRTVQPNLKQVLGNVLTPRARALLP
jgi:hypothetical protein